jgi:hypothetical protein
MAIQSRRSNIILSHGTRGRIFDIVSARRVWRPDAIARCSEDEAGVDLRSTAHDCGMSITKEMGKEVVENVDVGQSTDEVGSQIWWSSLAKCGSPDFRVQASNAKRFSKREGRRCLRPTIPRAASAAPFCVFITSSSNQLTSRCRLHVAIYKPKPIASS